MATRKPRTNNAVKAQARAHQKANPGTTYTAARAAVLRHDGGASSAHPFEASLKSLVGQNDAKVKLRQMVAMEEVRAERDRRAHEAKWAAQSTPPPPYDRRVLPKVRIEGPPGSGKSTVANLVHDEMVRVSRASAEDVRKHFEKLREERAEEYRQSFEKRREERERRGEEPPEWFEDKPVHVEPTRAIPTTTVEASRLTGRYIGEAQRLIQPVVERAEWGLLVIENIHDLTAYNDSFRRESLSVLTSELRLVAHTTAVCATGCRMPVKNPAAKEFEGLFPVTVELGSITPNDARELAVRFAREMIEPLALDAIEEHVHEMEKLSEGETRPLIDVLGNARFIRSVVEQASNNNVARLSLRDLSTVTDEELTTLTVEDVSAALKASALCRRSLRYART